MAMTLDAQASKIFQVGTTMLPDAIDCFDIHDAIGLREIRCAVEHALQGLSYRYWQARQTIMLCLDTAMAIVNADLNDITQLDISIACRHLSFAIETACQAYGEINTEIDETN